MVLSRQRTDKNNKWFKLPSTSSVFILTHCNGFWSSFICCTVFFICYILLCRWNKFLMLHYRFFRSVFWFLGSLKHHSFYLQACKWVRYSCVILHRTSCESKHSFIRVGFCDTRGSNCSVQPIDSVLHCFCADVLASTHTGSIRSLPYVFSGVNAGILHITKQH